MRITLVSIRPVFRFESLILQPKVKCSLQSVFVSYTPLDFS